VLRHLHSLRVIRSRMHACCGVFGRQPQLLNGFCWCLRRYPVGRLLTVPTAKPPPMRNTATAVQSAPSTVHRGVSVALRRWTRTECSRRRPNTARTTYEPRRPVRRPDVRVSVSAGVMSVSARNMAMQPRLRCVGRGFIVPAHPVLGLA